MIVLTSSLELKLAKTFVKLETINIVFLHIFYITREENYLYYLNQVHFKFEKHILFGACA